MYAQRFQIFLVTIFCVSQGPQSALLVFGATIHMVNATAL